MLILVNARLAGIARQYCTAQKLIKKVANIVPQTARNSFQFLFLSFLMPVIVIDVGKVVVKRIEVQSEMLNLCMHFSCLFSYGARQPGDNIDKINNNVAIKVQRLATFGGEMKQKVFFFTSKFFLFWKIYFRVQIEIQFLLMWFAQRPETRWRTFTCINLCAWKCFPSHVVHPFFSQRIHTSSNGPPLAKYPTFTHVCIDTQWHLVKNGI